MIPQEIKAPNTMSKEITISPHNFSSFLNAFAVFIVTPPQHYGGVWCFPYDVCRCLWCGLESLVKRGAVSFIVSVFKLDKKMLSPSFYIKTVAGH